MLYWNQLKNKMFPYSSCFNSSVAMFLSDFEIQKTPDQVYRELREPSLTTWGKKRYPASWWQWKKKRRMLWALECEYINRQFEKYGVNKIAVWNEGRPVNLTKELRKSPVIVGTKPRYQGRRLGHIMVLASAVSDGMEKFFLNDPFGNPLGEYQVGSDGHLVLVTVEYFRSIYAGNCIYIQEG